LAVFAVALLLAGCASKPPKWVDKGASAFKDSGAKVFYGVGAITGVQNRPLAVTAADNRARAEVGKLFEVYIASLMKDYTASSTGGAAVSAKSPTSEQQSIDQAVKTFSATTLSGVTIVDRWTDPKDRTEYSLARLDLDKFQTSIETMKELSSGLREYIKKNAEKSFDSLSDEEAKRAAGRPSR
jgi:hypothetical protein